MKKGDMAQLAVWYCEEDDQKKIAWWRKEGCAMQMKASADYFRVKLSKVKFYELDPGESNAGHPPEGRQGTNFKLLVGEAEVVADLPQVASKTFVQDLTMKDLALLRNVTRKAYAMHNPQIQVALSDDGCDEVINELGPDAVESLLRQAADATKH